MKPITVYITVQGGVVQEVEAPDGLRVVIMDYDAADDCEEDGEHIKSDDSGEPYFEAVYDF